MPHESVVSNTTCRCVSILTLGYFFKHSVLLLRVCHPQQDSQKILQKKLNCHTTHCGCTVKLTESLGSNQKTKSLCRAQWIIKAKLTKTVHSRERCQKIWFQMMICYALQATTFIMQKFENASKSWSFGGKGKKTPKQNQNRPKTLYEKCWWIDSLERSNRGVRTFLIHRELNKTVFWVWTEVQVTSSILHWHCSCL